MKNLIFIISLIFIAISCNTEIENEHYNPNYLITVNFPQNKATESGKLLQKTSAKESEICTKIIRNNPILENVKFNNLCSGANEYGLNFAYIIITGEINGYFLVVFDENRIQSFRLTSYDSKDCMYRWIKEV